MLLMFLTDRVRVTVQFFFKHNIKANITLQIQSKVIRPQTKIMSKMQKHYAL